MFRISVSRSAGRGATSTIGRGRHETGHVVGLVPERNRVRVSL